MLATVLIASFFVMLVSLSGKLVTWRIAGPFIDRNLHFFVSFAAGVLLVVAFNLSREIVEHAGSLTEGLPWIAIGAVIILIGFRYLPQFHHHHDAGALDHQHMRLDAGRVLVSDGIHNIGDGVVIVASFAASPLVGVATTFSILIHEMLQEISEFFVLRQAGLSVSRALIYNLISSSTILIGTIGAFFLLDRFEHLEVPLLGISVGGYLIIVFHDLIPHSLGSAHSSSHYLRHFVYFVVGVSLMYTLVSYLPHEEPQHEEIAFQDRIARDIVWG